MHVRPFERPAEIARKPVAKEQCHIHVQRPAGNAFAHNPGVVHRDIRPSNIVLSPEGKVKLTDFGLALEVAAASDVADDDLPLSGSPAYMAPEQVASERVDGRTDIYALGIVTYELLTGSPPFVGRLHEIRELQRTTPVPSPRSKDSRVPEDLEELVRRATAKAPEDRFQSCEEIVRLLAEVQEVETGPLGLAVKTVTFVYKPSLEATVSHLIENLQERADEIDDLEVR
ncbi:MAG: serine/threonine-protein kinase [Acidobacteriota bacterium]